MNAIDYHYYSSFDEIGKPFYDWERQIINLGCNISDIDISNASSDVNDEGKKHSSRLIHEYIHFLQNFSTAWGAPVFTDFTLALIKIGASSAESKEILELPLIKANLKSELLIDGINQREDVLKRLSKHNKNEFHSDGELTKVLLKQTNEECVILFNGRVTSELGIKVIREHMAHLGTQMFLNKSDEEIHYYNQTTSGFTKNGIEFSDQPEYWILYEYFYEMELLIDVAKGVFHLTQQCLITLNPEKALLRFINWFQSNESNYTEGASLITVVEDWLQSDDEILFLEVGLTKSIEHCEKILDLTKRNLSKHDIFQFAHDITEYALHNIIETKGGKLLFSPKDDFSDIKYWKNKIATYGTGIVRYLDGVKIHGASEHCDKMPNSFNFLISCSLVIKKILENQKSTCPFLFDIPICKASYYDSDNCHSNPFEILQNNAKGEQCLFGNGILLIGMENRVNFNI